MLDRLLPWGAIAVVLALLLAHTLRIESIQVDNSTLVLLGLFCIIPSIRLIRKIKLGEFEAEIAPREVAELRAKASIELPPPRKISLSQAKTLSSVADLVRQDPALGLARLRLELEQSLRYLYAQVEPDKKGRPASLLRMVDRLVERGVIPSVEVDALREVVQLANRAIHGERVRQQDADALAVVGSQLLESLKTVIEGRIVLPAESRVITNDELEGFLASQYRVTSVVPYVQNPQLNVRIVDQEGLSILLNGYEDVGEFLVSIERLGR